MLPKIDEETILEVKAGTMAAFEKVLSLYEDRIFTYIYRFVGNREDAEDLTQETFISFYTHLDQIDAEKNFSGWLYKIATNNAFDWLRKKKRIKEIPLLREETGGEVAASVYPGDSSALRNPIKEIEEAGDVQSALRELKPIYQSLLILYYYDGFSQKEISKLLAMPLGTVKTKMRQARLNLKEVLVKNDSLDAKSAGTSHKYGLYFSKN